VIDRGTEIVWLSEGPKGHKMRRGVVRAHVPPGRQLRLPKSADPAKCRVALVNAVHARYLVEIPRANKRSGRKLASLWMAPKAVTLDKVAEVVD
jgi:D-aminopeptidase